jgi:hypothetical protein
LKVLAPGLVFELDPESDGDLDWQLAVKPDESSNTNYAKCVTGPLHGPTPIDIEAWQWALLANGKTWDSAPSVHEFDFVLDAAGNKKVCDEADREAFDTERNHMQIGDPHYKDPPLGHARVTICWVELKASAPDGQARFAKIRFDAEITLPMSYAPHHAP